MLFRLWSQLYSPTYTTTAAAADAPQSRTMATVIDRNQPHRCGGGGGREG